LKKKGKLRIRGRKKRKQEKGGGGKRATAFSTIFANSPSAWHWVWSRKAEAGRGGETGKRRKREGKRGERVR